MDLLTYHFSGLLELMRGPHGIVALVLLLLLPLALFVFDRIKWVVLALVVYIAGLGRPHEIHFPDLVGVLQSLDSASRSLITFFLFLLIIPTIWTKGGSWRKRLWFGGTLVFCVCEFAVSLRDIFGGGTDRGVLEFVDYALIFLVMVVGVSRWLQSVSDADAAIKCLCAASVLFVVGTAAQIASGSGFIMASRLTATAANPNFAAEAITAGLPATLYLVVRKERSPLWRIVAAATAGLLLVMLVWSGSRGGALRCLIILFVMFRRRMGSFLVTGTVIGLVVYGGLVLYGSKIEFIGRAFTLTDNRTAIWITLLRGFLENPAFGIGSASVGSENSYLVAASHAGLMALLPLVLGVGMIVHSLATLRSRRNELGDDKLLFDMAAAAVIATLAGAFFDGYLIANFSTLLFSFFIYLALLAFVRDGLDHFSGTEPQNVADHETPDGLIPAHEVDQEPVYG
ncbi:MAG TPA: O-antigen ligase family protein [Humisphaera sp.]|jgi:hypothetical protein|nr:O-antigen ligase family protein [Humisphaera sp.]